MALEDVLVHEGRLVSTVTVGPRVQGERQTEPEAGPLFDCLLQLDKGTERDRRAGTQELHAALLFLPVDRANAVLKVTAKDRVAVLAPELTGGDPVVWTINGDPEPMAPPGEVIGYEASLSREKD